MSHFEYKGYIGSAEVDAENGILFGRLLFIKDIIGYHASGVNELHAAFEEAVDDYLAACEEEGSAPEVPCKGSFNVRVGADRHRQAALRARQKGIGLNDYVCHALDQEQVAANQKTVVHRHEFVLTSTSEQVSRIATAAQPAELETVGVTARH